jgi:hypothetical protein
VNRLSGLLPGGHWDVTGTRHRDVTVRPLSGVDEELLAEAGPADTAAAVTAVLHRCLVHLGDVDPITASVVRALPVGDREYLLVLLRRVTLGDRVRGDLFCPWPGCGERVGIDIHLPDLPVHEAEVDATTGRVTVVLTAADGVPGQVEVELRLPDGGDVEALSDFSRHDEPAATLALLTRLIHRIGSEQPPPHPAVAALPPAARAHLEAELERAAPGIERTVDVRCWGCGRGFEAPLDVRRYLLGPLVTDPDLLYREVARLAVHYHWSEAELMAMSRPRRQRYLDLALEDPEAGP